MPSSFYYKRDNMHDAHDAYDYVYSSSLERNNFEMAVRDLINTRYETDTRIRSENREPDEDIFNESEAEYLLRRLSKLSISNEGENQKEEREPKKSIIRESEDIGYEREGVFNIRTLPKLSPMKDRYQQGILAASDVIVAIITSGGECNELILDTIIAALVRGSPTVAKSAEGRKALTKSKSSDRAFAEMAFIAATKTLELGGTTEKMYYAAAAVLTCRGQKKYRKLKISTHQMDELTDSVAHEAITFY